MLSNFLSAYRVSMHDDYPTFYQCKKYFFKKTMLALIFVILYAAYYEVLEMIGSKNVARRKVLEDEERRKAKV